MEKDNLVKVLEWFLTYNNSTDNVLSRIYETKHSDNYKCRNCVRFACIIENVGICLNTFERMTKQSIRNCASKEVAIMKPVSEDLRKGVTSIDSDYPHYHDFNIDGEGNGSATGLYGDSGAKPHNHIITKYVVYAAGEDMHAHGINLKDSRIGHESLVRIRENSKRTLEALRSTDDLKTVLSIVDRYLSEARTPGLQKAIHNSEEKTSCPTCGFRVPVYKGRYPNNCPECNAKLVMKESLDPVAAVLMAHISGHGGPPGLRDIGLYIKNQGKDINLDQLGKEIIKNGYKLRSSSPSALQNLYNNLKKVLD